jgi:hypothetical protein
VQVHLVGREGDDSTPVRGAFYEPTVLLGVSAELRLSHEECFDRLNWVGRSFDGLPTDLRDSGGPECRDFTNTTTAINTTITTTSWPLWPRCPSSSRELRLWSGRPGNSAARSSSFTYFVGISFFSVIEDRTQPHI